MNSTPGQGYQPGDPALQSSVWQLKEAIKEISGRPGFNRYKSLLYGKDSAADDEVVVVRDPVGEQEIPKLRKAVLALRLKVMKISKQYKLPYKEILAQAIDQHKKELSLQSGQLVILERINPNDSVVLPENRLGPPRNIAQSEPPPLVLLQQPPQQLNAATTSLDNISRISPQNQRLMSSLLPQQSTHLVPQKVDQLLMASSSVAPTALVEVPSECINSPSPSSSNQNQPQQILATSSRSSSTSSSNIHSREEERMLRYGKALLKLKQYRRNLKYAVWDFQDGKTIEEACSTHKIPENGLKYTIDMIVRKTGQTVEQFRDNKSIACDEHSDKSNDYILRLRESVLAFKLQKCGSLFVYASQKNVSLFDLIDELIKELEIESKLHRLQPVEPSELRLLQIPNFTISCSSSSSSISSFNNHILNQGASTSSSIISSTQITASVSASVGGAPVTAVAPIVAAASAVASVAHSSVAHSSVAHSSVAHSSGPSPSSSSNSFNPEENEASILSDIDEVIRDDTNNAVSLFSHGHHHQQQQHHHIHQQQHRPGDHQPQQEHEQVGLAHTTDNNVITLNICDVCNRMFTNEVLFKEHEAGGCIDYEI